MNIEEFQQKLIARDIVGRMNAYGRGTVEKFGQEYQSSAFTGSYERVADITAFVELEEGGCETYVQGHKFPMRQCFAPERVKTTHQFKRLIPTLFYTIKEHPIIGLAYVWLNYDKLVDFMHRGLADAMYQDVKFYSQPVREIYLSMSWLGLDRERDIVCTILENDCAYRYRVQDILILLDKGKFRENPMGELRRLWAIVESRERIGHGFSRFRKVLSLVSWYFRLHPGRLDVLKDVVARLGVDEVASRIEDLYWQYDYRDYDFRGYSYERRQQFKESLLKFNRTDMNEQERAFL